MRLLLVCLALLPAVLASIHYDKPRPHQGNHYVVDPHAVNGGKKSSYVRPTYAVGGPGSRSGKGGRFSSSGSQFTGFDGGRFGSDSKFTGFDGGRSSSGSQFTGFKGGRSGSGSRFPSGGGGGFSGSGSRSDPHQANGGRFFNKKPHAVASGLSSKLGDGSSRRFGERHPSAGGRRSFRKNSRDNKQRDRSTGRKKAPSQRYPSGSHAPVH